MNSTFESNSAPSGSGGGLLLASTDEPHQLAAHGCAFSGNRAAAGGGLAALGPVSLALRGCSLRSNIALHNVSYFGTDAASATSSAAGGGLLVSLRWCQHLPVGKQLHVCIAALTDVGDLERIAMWPFL